MIGMAIRRFVLSQGQTKVKEKRIHHIRSKRHRRTAEARRKPQQLNRKTKARPPNHK